MRDFLHDCVASGPSEQSDRIREAVQVLGVGQAAGSIDAKLASGAEESAVLELIGPETAFMLSRGGNGSCLAAVVLLDGSEEMISEGSTLALAMLAAHVSSLLADAEQSEPASRHQATAGVIFN